MGRGQAGSGRHACLGTVHSPVLKRTVDISLDRLDGKLRPVGPTPYLEVREWLGYWPEGWNSALCSRDQQIPSFHVCCLLPSWLLITSFSLSLGSLPDLLVLVLGCRKLVVPLDVSYSGPSKAVSVGTRTRSYLGIVDKEKLGIGQVQSWQSLVPATFSQPL